MNKKLYTSPERKAEYWKRKNAPKTRLVRAERDDLASKLRRKYRSAQWNG